MNILAVILIIGGVFFLTVGSLGVIRLPDFYSRTHAVGKSDTLGLLLAMAGLAIYHGWHIDSLKILLVAVFVGLSNPTASHALARAALRKGLAPWTRGGRT
ncbi:MAG: monovalent cation/H(+) antiporter subunit G [Candidatus Eisenbacteria bacterium]|uniref:Monovalent cation/H(+) antiporter subunit G n=1 Tax=Eiseniibacteriota bacterium TaxID=2212470 RepID=A0A948W6N5_UNCEI|nr:monovalent cation/H(+) antiporter subunit G [Candidatus Eisenbacteria bacterium]MBU1947471.1 monovalent cation/H(+) antiporter subunit G [Candidatus Eisenbacteria bacterium]MBU2690836.1 monovalent cation/H(+) antiporter subunit G [Candidatus Eisenbacteria bacterium]